MASGDEAAEIARLTAPDPRLGLPVPAYDGRSLPNIAASVAAAVGLSDPAPPPMAPPLAADLDPFRGRRAEGPVVVLLVDGFGWNSFAGWRGDDRTEAARRWGARARPITTVFPTTTTAALVSLSTATFPARHGIVGYRQFLPRFGVVADILHMAPVGVTTAEALIGPDWTPDLLSGAPSIFRRGVDGVAVSRDRFEGSGLTRLLYDGASFVPYATASDLAHQLIEQLERPNPPTVVYAYWDELDTVHHLRGPRDRLFAFEADRLAHLVGYVARHVARPRAAQTTLLVTADHGQVPIDPARQLRVDAIPELAHAMARPLAGDRLSGYFAAVPGRADELDAALKRHLPPGSRVVEAETAVAAGLFGPPPYHPELLARIGDRIAFVPAPSGLVSVPPGRRPSMRDLLGAHGGLTAQELLVPLVAGRLAEFADAEREG